MQKEIVTDSTPAPVVLERTIAASPDLVFRALTEKEYLECWFFTACKTIEASTGGSYRIRWEGEKADNSHERFGKYLEVVPNEKLVFEWRGFTWKPDPEPPTIVSITLTPVDGGTHLRLEHSGWPMGWDEVRDSHGRGWTFYTEHLGDYLAGKPDRRPAEFGQRVNIH